MIGRTYNSSIDINNNDATYSIVEVVSECEDYLDKDNKTFVKDYQYGVGGFIGNCRSDNDRKVSIQNVIVGTENQQYLTNVK